MLETFNIAPLIGANISVNTFWYTFAELAGALGIIFGVYKIFIEWYNSSTEASNKRHLERIKQDGLNTLAEHSEEIVEAIIGMRHYEERLDLIQETLEAVVEQNRNHAIMIEDSLEERKYLMNGTLALLDKAIEDGANGTSHKARDEIREYQTRKSHEVRY